MSPDVIEQIVQYPAKHLRVLGLPGSGKTRLLIDRYKALTRGSDSAPVFILTYSREQLLRITDVLLTEGSAHGGMLPVFTHFLLAREIISAAGGETPRMIESIEETLLVEKIVRRNEKKLRSDYRKICSSERFQRELLDLFHLLQQNGLSGDSVRGFMDEQPGPECADMLRLYIDFTAALHDERAATFYDIAWIAKAVCPRLPRDHGLRRAAVLLVDDFQDIDPGQFALLRALAPPDGPTALNAFGDPMGAYFAARGTDSRFITTEFPRIYGGDTFNLERRCHAEGVLGRTLDALAAEVLGGQAAAFVPNRPEQAGEWGPLFDTATAKSGSVALRVVADEVAEVYEAAARAHQLIAGGRYRPGDIAVVTNEKTRYEPMLRAAFAQRGIPLETGRPVYGALRSFVHALLQLFQSTHDDVALQALVTSPFFPYFRSKCLAADDRADLEPYRLHEAVTAYLRKESATMRGKNAAQWVAHIVTHCIQPACAGYREQTGDDRIYTFISTLKERWTEYATAAETVGAPVELASFIRRSGLFAARPAVPAPSSLEVGFYSCREIKNRSFPVVLVLGCSEMLFPSVIRRETILPAVELQRFLDRSLPDHRVRVHAARTAEEHLRDECHLLYHSFTRAGDVLEIFAPRKFAGQAYPAPSTVIDETLTATALVECEEGRRVPPGVGFASSWVKRGVGAAADPRLAELSPLGGLWNEDPGPTREFAVETFPLSKTSLETYTKCPRRFFYNKVLRVKEEESGALKVGKIFHEVLAALARPFRTKGEFHAAATDEQISAAIEQELERDRTARPGTLFGASLRFFLFYMIKSALRHDRETSDEYEIAAVESNLDFELKGFAFTGRADIIESSAGGSVLVDYKTGDFKKTGKHLRERTLDALTHPEKANWQVPLYVWGQGEQAHALPTAFKPIVQHPGEDPFHVTLHIAKSDHDVPAAARSRKKGDQGHSYVLEAEVQEIMARAASFAAEIFGNRGGFERTEDLAQCRNCAFASLCDRRVE